MAQLRAADAGGPSRASRRSSTSGPTRASTGCARLPYVRAWAAKYRDDGLTVIGVHTPEFGFRKEHRQRHRAVAGSRRRVSDRGRQPTTRSGPRSRTTSGRRLHRRRAKAGSDSITSARASTRWPRWSSSSCCSTKPAGGIDRDLVSVEPHGLRSRGRLADARDPRDVSSATARAAASRRRTTREFDEPRAYPVPVGSASTSGHSSGRGRVAQHAAVLNEPGGRIAFQFQARDVNLVMGPAARGTSVPFRVFLDGEPRPAPHGFDVDDHGNGTVADQRTVPADPPAGPSRRASRRDRVPSTRASRPTASPSADE